VAALDFLSPTRKPVKRGILHLSAEAKLRQRGSIEKVQLTDYLRTRRRLGFQYFTQFCRISSSPERQQLGSENNSHQKISPVRHLGQIARDEEVRSSAVSD